MLILNESPGIKMEFYAISHFPINEGQPREESPERMDFGASKCTWHLGTTEKDPHSHYARYFIDGSFLEKEISSLPKWNAKEKESHGAPAFLISLSFFLLRH